MDFCKDSHGRKKRSCRLQLVKRTFFTNAMSAQVVDVKLYIHCSRASKCMIYALTGRHKNCWKVVRINRSLSNARVWYAGQHQVQEL